jgi:hypothetical protein
LGNKFIIKKEPLRKLKSKVREDVSLFLDEIRTTSRRDSRDRIAIFMKEIEKSTCAMIRDLEQMLASAKSARRLIRRRLWGF